MSQSVNARSLVEKLASFQKVQPYNGWDIQKFPDFINEVTAYLEDPAHRLDTAKTELGFLKEFLLCFRTSPKPFSSEKKGISITQLNRLADAIRLFLGLPSIAELNPEWFKFTKDRPSLKEDFEKTLNKVRLSSPGNC